MMYLLSNEMVSSASQAISCHWTCRSNIKKSSLFQFQTQNFTPKLFLLLGLPTPPETLFAVPKSSAILLISVNRDICFFSDIWYLQLIAMAAAKQPSVDLADINTMK